MKIVLWSLMICWALQLGVDNVCSPLWNHSNCTVNCCSIYRCFHYSGRSCQCPQYEPPPPFSNIIATTAIIMFHSASTVCAEAPVFLWVKNIISAWFPIAAALMIHASMASMAITIWFQSLLDVGRRMNESMNRPALLPVMVPM